MLVCVCMRVACEICASFRAYGFPRPPLSREYKYLRDSFSPHLVVRRDVEADNSHMNAAVGNVAVGVRTGKRSVGVRHRIHMRLYVRTVTEHGLQFFQALLA